MSQELFVSPFFEPLGHLVGIFLCGVLMIVLIDLPNPRSKSDQSAV